MATIDEILTEKAPAERPLTVQLGNGKTTTLLFRALSRQRWNALIEACPATNEQQQAFLDAQLSQGIPPTRCQRLRWNEVTFSPAAIAACCVDPAGVTLAQATEWWTSDRWSDDELTKVIAGIIAVNESSGTAEWGKGSAATHASGTSSPPPTTTASPSANGGRGRKTTKTPRSRTSDT